MIASGIIIILLLIILSIWGTYESLFAENDHFILKRVVVKGGGWWKSRSKEVEEVLELKRGETNLFALDLGEKRKKLEKEPSIQKVSISRILPDTLLVEISERIPRAFLYWKGNSTIVDADGIVMSKKSCISLDKNLPVFTGFRAKKEDLLPGNYLHQIAPALKLLEVASKEIPGVMLLRINLSNPKHFNAEIYIPETRKIYTLYVNRKGLNEKLKELRAVLQDIPKTKPKATVIDLRYKEKAVIK